MDIDARFSIVTGREGSRETSPLNPEPALGPQAWILLATAFLGPTKTLVYRDPFGVWFSKRTLTERLKRALEETLSPRQGLHPELEGLFLLETISLSKGRPEDPVGTLFVLAPEVHPLAEAEMEGLQQLARQLGGQASEERRAISRGPSGASFVPGLAHELRNFAFSISASLDAFEVRFGGEETTEQYRLNLRKSLNRLIVFIEELLEYGDPRRRPWTELTLEPILLEAMEYHRESATAQGLRMDLQIEGTLPRIRGDEVGLSLAFMHLLDLGLQTAKSSGTIELHAHGSQDSNGGEIRGHLDLPLDLGSLDLARLFEPFYYRPTGLGRLALPVARRILEGHGGNLEATPRLEGGLRLNFTLPVN